MSVAAERSHSPTHFGHKRSFEPADSPEQHAYSSEHHTKRPRRHHRASVSREGRSDAQHASAARASTLLALKALFPGMEEQVCQPTCLTHMKLVPCCIWMYLKCAAILYHTFMPNSQDVPSLV